MVERKSSDTFNIEQRVYLPGPLRYLPWGLGYEVVGITRVSSSLEDAQRLAENSGDTNIAGWKIENVPVRAKEARK